MVVDGGEAGPVYLLVGHSLENASERVISACGKDNGLFLAACANTSLALKMGGAGSARSFDT